VRSGIELLRQLTTSSRLQAPRLLARFGVCASLFGCGEGVADAPPSSGGSAGAAASGGASGSGTGGSGAEQTGGAAGSAGTGGASGAGVGGSGGTSGSNGSGGSGGTSCTDECPAPNGGVSVGCKRRFMYGMNYAWQHFGGDFGGIQAWGQHGAATNEAVHTTNLADMRAHGVGTVRWWVFPDFRGDGVSFDGNDDPTGLGGTIADDIDAALRIAAEHDLSVMLCLFSFDAFASSRDVSGIWTPSIRPLILDAGRRRKLLDNVIRPLAKLVASSPHRDRMIAWDVINEPELAMTGASPYGDPAYDPVGSVQPVNHAEMETFIRETIEVLHQESSALVSVGSTAVAWRNAWSKVGIDFHQFHIYPWVNQDYPYTRSPAEYGVDNLPVVMGEFPLEGLGGGATYGAIVDSFWKNGYAGALGWDYGSASPDKLDQVAAFAADKACATRF
jgi:hypothetical protein